MEQQSGTTEMKNGGGKERAGYKGKNFKVNYNPGAGRLLVQTHTSAVPDRYHEFAFEPSGLVAFADEMASMVEYRRISTFNGEIDQALLLGGTRRMVKLAASKKIATAVDKRNATTYNAELSMISRLSISLPRPLLDVIEGLGFFTLGEAQWRMKDAMFWTSHLLVDAVHIAGQNGVPQPVPGGTLFINEAVPDSIELLFEFQRGEYNHWSRTTDERVQVNAQGRPFSFRPPETSRGWVPLNAMLMQAGVQPPPYITRALNILVAIEEGMARQGYPDAQLRQELAAERVTVVNWNRMMVAARVAEYIYVVENTLGPLYRTDFEWCEGVTSFSKEGQPWQLINCENPERGRQPFPVGQAQADVGFMLGGRTHYVFDGEQMQTWADTTPREMRQTYLRNKRINKV